MSQLLIPGAPLTFTLTASGLNTTIYVDGCDYTMETRKFQRKEFSNAYLMNLPEADGSEPIFVKNAVGKPIQIQWNCGNQTVRSVLPDDANIDKILQEMQVVTYTLALGPTSPSALDSLFPVFEDHKLRYASFDAYLDMFSLKLSITEVLSFQSIVFSYLTTTGLTMSGGELLQGSPNNVTANNCLIRSFTPGVVYTNPSQTSITCKGASLQIDQIFSINQARVYQS